MSKRRKAKNPKKGRNLIARAAHGRTGAGPMKDKRKLSRQQQKLRDRREAERAGAPD